MEGSYTQPRALIECCGVITICPGFPCLCLWPCDWLACLTCNWFDICGCGFPQWCNACSGCNIGLIGALGNPCSLFNLGLFGDCLNPCSGINLGILGACLNPCSWLDIQSYFNSWSCGSCHYPLCFIPSCSLCNWCCWGVGETWLAILSYPIWGPTSTMTLMAEAFSAATSFASALFGWCACES